MKLTTMTQITVDGVVQGSGGASDEDRRNGFPGNGPDIALGLAESRADSKGITIQVYRSAGRPQYATA